MMTAFVVGPTGMRRYTGRLMVLMMCFMPLLLEREDAIWRAGLMVLGTSCLLRGFSLTCGKTAYPLHIRLIAVLTPIDARRYTTLDRPVNWTLLACIFGNVVTATTVFLVMPSDLASLTGYEGIALRWAFGIPLFLSIPNLVSNGSVFIAELVGYAVAPVHRQPYLSVSLSDFWHRRWNLIVANTAARHIFLPIARKRRQTLAVWAVFSASALLHLWLSAMTAPLEICIPFTFYFLFQAPFALLERRIGLKDWPTWAGRVWTYLIVLGPSPMLTEWLMKLPGW